MKTEFVIAAVIFALTTTVTSAVEMNIGKTPVALVAPEGFCELMDSHPVDGRIVATVRQSMLPAHLLVQFTDCRQLAEWRTGKRKTLDHSFLYGARSNMTQPDVRASSADVKEFCIYLRGEGAKQFSSVDADLKTRIETSMKNIKVGTSQFIGVLAEEPYSCYWATLQSAQTETGVLKTNVVMSTVVLVKDKLVTAVLQSPFVDAGSVQAAFVKQKSNVAALLASNKK